MAAASSGAKKRITKVDMALQYDTLQPEAPIMIKKKRTWVRIAAHGQNIKEGHRHQWRCSLADAREDQGTAEIRLASCAFAGSANARNLFFLANRKGGTRMDGVVGWIELFGDVFIDENDILHVTLRDPQEGGG